MVKMKEYPWPRCPLRRGLGGICCLSVYNILKKYAREWSKASKSVCLTPHKTVDTPAQIC